ncbi:MAG TPA: type IV secretion system protein TraC [Gammaproteobacteria bacterium]|nr:type IV secretion system protein TraC [Gammaproteobacteria bacterium]
MKNWFNFSRWGEIISNCLGESMQFGVSKKTPSSQILGDFFDQYPLSSLLPYETYDPDTQLFYNKKSQGFMLEVSPLTGANEQTVQILASLLTDVLPTSADLQCLLWASDKVGDSIDAFAIERSQHSGIFSWLAQKRAEFLKNGTLQSLAADGNFILRDFKLYLVVSMPHKNQTNIEELSQVRDDITSSLRSLQMASRNIPIENFLSLMTDLLNPSSTCYAAHQPWHELDALSLQMTDPEYQLTVHPNQLKLNSEQENWDIRCFTVRDFPQTMTQWLMSENLGQLFNNALQIPCPFLISLHVRPLDQEKSSARAQMNFLNKDSTARSPLAKFKPTIRQEHHDWAFVRDRLAEGDRLVKVFYQVVIYAQPNYATSAERKVRDLYRANGWKLRKEAFLQLQSWLAMLPMMVTEGLYDDLRLFGRLRTLNAFAAANLLPLQGEWKGMQRPSLLLPGRRGQIAIWNPFDNPDGNYNVAIAAKSGSGKSVLTQEYIVALLGSGGRVWVIDVGRSYEKTCHMLGGEFIEFKTDSQISLNPFTFIKYFDDSLEILKPLLAAMARPNGNVTDEEMTYLEKALKAAWTEYGNQASITQVSNWLSQQQNETCERLGHLLYTYTQDGMYGKYFEGRCTLNFDNPFVVLELEELKAKKDLQKIVLLVLMYQISERMYLGTRTQTKSCVIDEAWDLLDGDNEGAAKFIETGYRRARRYNANFVTITQSINDYFKNATAIAAYENSDYNLILGQKSEAIDQLKASKRLNMDAYTERLFKDLKKTDDYSECIIKSPQGLSLHRIIFDPYSRILYSSKGEEFEAVKQLQAQGLSLKDAIAKVAELKFKKP